MTLLSWYRKYDKIAKRQGWSLFDADGVVEIQRIDEHGADACTDEEAAEIRRTHTQLSGDDEAFLLVFRQASKGCVMSLLAIYFSGRPVADCEDSNVWIPPKWLEEAERRKKHKPKTLKEKVCGETT